MKYISELKADQLNLECAVAEIIEQFTREQEPSDTPQEMNIETLLDAALLIHTFKKEQDFLDIIERYPDFYKRYRDAVVKWTPSFEALQKSAASSELLPKIDLWIKTVDVENERMSLPRHELEVRMNFWDVYGPTFPMAVLKDSNAEVRVETLVG